MNGNSNARVNYFDKQFLRTQDFVDEQLYHLALARLHNVAQHSWGIVSGLDLDLEQALPVIQPGLAVDGYGRLLILGQKQPLNVGMFDTLGTDILDVWLAYSRKDIKPAGGSNGCGNGNGQPYRSDETPLFSLEKPTASTVDARHPPGVTPGVLSSPVPPSSDDRNDVWKIYLGRVTRAPDNSYSIDSSERPYAGLVGQVIDHPGNPARVELGNISNQDDTRTIDNVTYTYQRAAATPPRGFAVFTEDPPQNNETQVVLAPRVDILQDGTLRARGLVSINGSVQLYGGAVQFNEVAAYTKDNAPPTPAIYRIQESDAARAADQLRIDLGSTNTPNREFVIGFSTGDGKFTPCLKLELKDPGTGKLSPLVTIYGDLKIAGLLDSPDPKPRALSQEALNAIMSAFTTGVAVGKSA